MYVVAHRACGEGRHPRQLPTAQKPDRAAREDRVHDAGRGSGWSSTSCVRAARQAVSFWCSAGSVVAEHLHREQGRVGRTRLPDGDGGDRNALRHLDDREQRIDAAERGGRDRHADDWERASWRRAFRGGALRRRRRR